MDSVDRHRLLRNFLDTWPLSRIEAMTLEEYAVGTTSRETFCYWLETYARRLGNIKGISGGGSFKFGIFFKNPSKHKNYNSRQYKDDGIYAWERRFGEERNTVFLEVKKRVVATVRHSIAKDFAAIEGVDKLFPLFKWKITFLYSDYNMVPIYHKPWLEQIAMELGSTNLQGTVSSLQHFIVSKRPSNIDFFEWYDWLLATFIKNAHSYFVIGSQYLNEDLQQRESVLRKFYQYSTVAIGFLYKNSLSSRFSRGIKEINTFLQGLNLRPNETEAIRHFLMIRKGDVIAIKDFGIAGKLKIAAYAIVIEDPANGGYQYDPKDLGHRMRVEFLEMDVNLELQLTKTHTIHRITDEAEINSIFGAYQQLEAGGEEEDEEDEEEARGRRRRKATSEKHTSGHQRTVIYSTWIDEFHNQLQKQFYKWLKIERNDPEEGRCLMEKDFVDVSYRDGNVVELYEVKPSPIPSKCIRQALGQLIYYSSFEKRSENLKLFVVGPGKLRREDGDLLSFVKSNLNIEFDYIQFSLNDIEL